MILDSARLVMWTRVFIGVIVFTMAQRLYHAYRMLSAGAGGNTPS